jgi:NAD(P)-dependent dehydrogenase (short-subunit alcohol dehydrogenase family)
MKIAVTGHTQGIGQSLSRVYQQHGHKVVGFSRSNGFDITDPTARQKIVQASQDCDVFINNAHSSPGDFAQTDLLFELWAAWEGQHKTIVNISSSMVMRWQQTPAGSAIAARASKLALENAAEQLWNRNAWPFVSVVAPCLTDTPRHQTPLSNFYNSTNKVNPDHFAELVYQNMSQTEFRVQMLKLAVKPLDQ